MYQAPPREDQPGLSSQVRSVGKEGTRQGPLLRELEDGRHTGRDPQGCGEALGARREDLLAERPSKPLPEPGVTVTPEGRPLIRLCRHFMESKDKRLATAELSKVTRDDYQRVMDFFGESRIVEELTVRDFEALPADIGKGTGPVHLGNELNLVRIILNYGVKSGLVAKPIVHGAGLKRPNKSVIRKDREERGQKFVTREEAKLLLDNCESVPLKAMVLLGISCGLGNADCGRLEFRHIDFALGLLDFPRPKTEVK